MIDKDKIIDFSDREIDDEIEKKMTDLQELEREVLAHAWDFYANHDKSEIEKYPPSIIFLWDVCEEVSQVRNDLELYEEEKYNRMVSNS